jgi:hypothetical protein
MDNHFFSYICFEFDLFQLIKPVITSEQANEKKGDVTSISFFGPVNQVLSIGIKIQG